MVSVQGICPLIKRLQRLFNNYRRQPHQQNLLFLLLVQQQRHRRRRLRYHRLNEQLLIDQTHYRLLPNNRYRLQRMYRQLLSTKMLTYIHRMESPSIQSYVRNVKDVDVKSAKGLDNYRLDGCVTIGVYVVPKQLFTIHRVCVVLKHCFTIVPIMRIMKWNAMVIVYRVRMIHAHVYRINEPNDGHGWVHYQLHCHVCGAIGRCEVVWHYVPNAMHGIHGMDVDVHKIKLITVMEWVMAAVADWVAIRSDEQLVERNAILHPKNDCLTPVLNTNYYRNQFKHVTKDCKRLLLNFRNFLINCNCYNYITRTDISERLKQLLNVKYCCFLLIRTNIFNLKV